MSIASSVTLLLASAQPSGAAGGIIGIAPLILIFVIFYFLLIRPQQKRAKEHEAKIGAVQKNDQVVTGGGLMGKAVKVTEDYVEVEIASGVKVKAVKSTLADVVPKNVKAAND